MRKFLCLLVCVLPALFAMADAQPASLQQMLRERHLTLGDNELTKRSSSRTTTNDVLGEMIASLDTIDFAWNDESGTVIVDEASRNNRGKMIEVYIGDDSQLYIRGLYGSFEIPVNIDFETGAVTLVTGEPAAVVIGDYTFGDGAFSHSEEERAQKVTKKIWTLYIMPLSWLEGDDNYDDVHGMVYYDGSMELEGGFAFLVEEQCYSGSSLLTTSWTMSPIYDNLMILRPNATHSFKLYSYIYPGGGSGGSGQMSLSYLSYLRWLLEFDTTGTGTGVGGVVVRPVDPRPQRPKPVNPRPIAPKPNNKGLTLSSMLNWGTPVVSAHMGMPLTTQDTRGIESVSAQVYAFMVDSTLYVYNLFGNDYCWNYMILHSDGTMEFPSQVVGRRSDGIRIYASANTNDMTMTIEGNWNDSQVTWGNTYLNNYTTTMSYSFRDNSLQLGVVYDGYYVPSPLFTEPLVTDEYVEFDVISPQASAVPEMYIYIEEEDAYYYLDNPWQAARGEESYWVSLAAQSWDEELGAYSNPVFLDYEVPALYVLIKGDVNGDKDVNIDDVIALIDVLLYDDLTGIDSAAADVDEDDELSINDVSALISYLLDGLW